MALSKCEAADAENLKMLNFIKKHLRINAEQEYANFAIIKLQIAGEEISSIKIEIDPIVR